MPRQIPFQHDRPLYVKIPFTAKGKRYERGDNFPWEVMKINPEKVELLYKNDFVHHSDKLERENKGVIGDGLHELTVAQLHDLVGKINEKVLTKAKTNDEYKKKKCPKSQVHDRQVGLIRRWRNTYGHFETE